jgi:hypothetical protein
MNGLVTENLRTVAQIKESYSKDEGGLSISNESMTLKLSVGDSLAVVILDNIIEITYYDTPFDGEAKFPTAFAFGREIKNMSWHENSSPEFAGNNCQQSDVLKFGSAKNGGKGKAAKEKIRLAVINAGMLDQYGALKSLATPSDIKSCSIAFISVPVASVSKYISYYNEVKEKSGLKPYAVITKITVTKVGLMGYELNFTTLAEIPDELLPFTDSRLSEAREVIYTPYPSYDSVKKIDTNRLENDALTGVNFAKF